MNLLTSFFLLVVPIHICTCFYSENFCDFYYYTYSLGSEAFCFVQPSCTHLWITDVNNICIVPEVLFVGCCFCGYPHWIGGIEEYYGSIICLSDAPDYLAELGTVYCDLGYLTRSLQAHGQALSITKEFTPDESKHQVSQTDSLMRNRYVLLDFEKFPYTRVLTIHWAWDPQKLVSLKI